MKRCAVMSWLATPGLALANTEVELINSSANDEPYGLALLVLGLISVLLSLRNLRPPRPPRSKRKNPARPLNQTSKAPNVRPLPIAPRDRTSNRARR